MTPLEKIISLSALCLLITVPTMLLFIPKLHTLPNLLPLSIALLIVSFVANAALLFVVFKDIFSRPFPTQTRRYIWVLLVFLCPPAIMVYLPMHGFRKR